MSFQTPQADMTSSSSNYFTPRQPSASTSTPRSSSMRNINAVSGVTPKNVRWPDEQQTQRGSQQVGRWQGIPSTPASTSLTTGSAPSTPAKPQAPAPAASTPAARPAPSTPTLSSAVRSVSNSLSQISSPVRGVTATRASVGALRSRMRWNAAAWVALIVVPLFDGSQQVLWSVADAVLAVLGSSAEANLLAATVWVRWACLLVFVVNFFEAGVQLYFSNGDASPSTAVKKPVGFSNPPGRAVSGNQVPSSTQNTPSRSVSQNVRYSPTSPLKSSLEAASRLSSQDGRKSYSGSLASSQRRLPSGPPSFLNGSTASPLAAYLARRGPSYSGDVSVDDDDVGADISTDSVEVDRALRALSNSYLRSSRSALGDGDESRDSLHLTPQTLNPAASTPVYAGR